MLKDLKTRIFRVKTAYGGIYVIECDNEKELCEYVFNLEKQGCIVSSVSEINLWNEPLSTPKVSIKSNPYYKQLQKEYFNKK